ncbi:MAG: FAD-binding oxidoreductase [Thermoprotei archaeon]
MKTDVIIIGGGIMGLATAYHLAKLGLKGIVFEQGYVGYGSSTRNASHFRVHFWSPENTKFAIEGRRRILKLATELSWNPLPIIGGYLWLIYDEKILRQFKEGNKIWSSLGVPGVFMSREQVSEKYEYLNVDKLIAAFYGPQNGKIHHDFVTYGYYEALLKLGFKVFEHKKVSSIVVSSNAVQGVKVDDSFIEADKVVVCAGAWSNEILSTINIKLPLIPERREIGVTEPFKIIIDPLIINTKSGVYVGQSIRGEIMGSIDYPDVKGLTTLSNTLQWMSRYAKTLIEIIPSLKHAKLMRIWSGYYETTPDHSHILGSDPEWPKGLYIGTGFSGHGFMMAPFAGEVLAEYIVNEKIHPLMEPYLPTRFREEKLIKETMIIG